MFDKTAACAITLATIASCGPGRVSSTAPPTSGPLTLRLANGADLTVELSATCGYVLGGARKVQELGHTNPGQGGDYSITLSQALPRSESSGRPSVAGLIAVNRGGASWRSTSGNGFLDVGQGGDTGELEDVVLQNTSNPNDELTLGGKWTCNEGQPK
jgi:hypothetical protein